MKREDKDNSTMIYNQLFILEFNQAQIHQHQVHKIAKHQSFS
jgi:hypothetical protein